MRLRFLLMLSLMLGLQGLTMAQYIRGKAIYHDHYGKPTAFPDSSYLELQPGGLRIQLVDSGAYEFGPLKPGKYWLAVISPEGTLYRADVTLRDADLLLPINAKPYSTQLGLVEIVEGPSGPEWLRAVVGTNIYAARKCELINMERVTANMATNNARQVFSRVPGLNIWENDGGGLQLGIGGRGLSPNRSSNFNTRQNGYDIAADALGYPESYYTPPVEALSKVEIVRGAAGLQFGTQFGGMVNFVFKEGPADKKIAVTSRQTLGSYGFFSSFNSLGGELANGKLNYYGFYQGKRGDGWRENSGFSQHTAYGSARLLMGHRMSLRAEYTYMRYLAQQAGGLTDAMYLRDPRQSIRDRNWFFVNWNLAALKFNWAIRNDRRMDVNVFGLHARRDALGYLGSINRADPGGNRDLITGFFRNIGAEGRYLQKYSIRESAVALLVGARYYQGLGSSKQGYADAGSGPSFQLLHPELPEGSAYNFPSRNVALFVEQVHFLNDKWSLVPGLRYEYIHTGSEGSFQVRNTDLAGNLLYEATVPDSRYRSRSILLAGLGASYKPTKHVEVYANTSRNYRAITFNDMRVVNPNFEIDPMLRDERGFNSDLGLRGELFPGFSVDASLFLLYYQDRIGQVLVTDSTTYRYYRLRTNVSDSRNLGLECYGELDILQLANRKKEGRRLSVFANVAMIDARYIGSKESAYADKRVELVPVLNLKTGLDWQGGPFKANVQWSLVTEQFSDATNAISSPNAVEGLIPAYQVLDLTAGYTWRWLGLEVSGNNLLNTMYYTRRAAAYPGPGIIPSDGRSFFLTLAVRI